MEAKNEILFKNDVEMLEKRLNRKLNEKELAGIRAQYDNPVFTSVSLRKGEGDIRKLKTCDYRQLQDRHERDMLAYLNFINGSISDLYVMLCVIAKKMGIEEPLKEASDFSIEITSKINENK